MAGRTTCSCPDVNDQDWHLQDRDWSGKFFYFEYVQHLFYMPLQLDKVIQNMKLDIARKGYQPVNPDQILYLPGSFQGRVLMEIQDPEQYDANVEKFENARILSRVYKGPRNRIKNAVEELKAFTQDKTHLIPSKIYYWHTTCPKCAPTKGGDKTVLFARV
jgi:hypothetical protein